MAKPKSKKLSPVDEYNARRVREDQERTALLPPGLVNNANTCFLNSVLQALIATPILKSLVMDAQEELDIPNARISRERSPVLSRNRQVEPYAKAWERGTPLCDAFLRFMPRAWKSLETPGFQGSFSPREILIEIGRKYDQYLDFRQQDSHELLRHLLDGMYMEEFDVIKRLQPPPAKETKRARKRSALSNLHASSQKPEIDKNDTPSIPEEQKLASFADMVFGGKFASILVCQGCKHVSVTYEDFMDLSLSLNADPRESKRDRLRSLARKVRSAAFASTQSLPGSPRPSSPYDHRLSEAILNAGGPRRSFDADRKPTITLVSSPPLPSPDGLPEGFATRIGRKVSISLSRKPKAPSKERSSPTATDTSQDNGKMKESPPNGVANGHATKPPVPPLPTEPPLTTIRPIKPRSANPAKPNIKEAAYLHSILRDIPAAHPNLSSLIRLNRSPDDPGASHSSPSFWLQTTQGEDGILECLRQFTAVEAMEGDNVVACHKCWKLAYPEEARRRRKEKEENAGNNDDDDDDDTDDEEEESQESEPARKPSRDTTAPAHARVNGTRSSTSSKPLPPIKDQLITSASTSAIPDLSSKQPPSPGGSDLASSIASTPAYTSPTSPENTPSTHKASSSMLPALDTYQGLPIPSISTTSPTTGEVPAPDDPAFRRHSIMALPTTSHNSLVAPSIGSRRYSSHTTTMSSVFTSDESADDSSSVVSDVSSASNKPPPPKVSIKTQPSQKSKQVINRPALKRYLIATPPPVLVIHLKRFQQVHKSSVAVFSSFKKIDDYVSFPEYLDIRPFIAPRREDFGLGKTKSGKGDVDYGRLAKWKLGGDSQPEPEPVSYRLYAVVVHIGSMAGGHYISYTALPSTPSLEPTTNHKDKTSSDQPPVERQWCYISDTVVRLVPVEDVLKLKAYLLFYERVA